MARAPFHRLSLTLPTARLTVALAVLGVLVIAAAALFAGFFVTSLREVELTSIRNRLEVPAQAMAHVLQAISKNADLTLRDVRVAAAHERGKEPSLGALRQAMLDHLHNRSMATKIELYDAEGRLVVSSVSASPPSVSVANYDFSKRQIAAASDHMLGSGLIADPLDGTTTFTASRPLRNAAGAVEGVVAVYFDTASIQGIFDSLGLPSGTSVVLFTRDGRHLLRSGPILALGDKLLAVDF